MRAVIALCSMAAVAIAAGSDVSGDVQPDVQPDVQLRAMRDELQRAKTLTLNQLDKPYFIQYTASDNRQFAASASLGGLLNEAALHVRQPKLQVRVGSYQLDNTNATFSREPRFTPLPLDDDYLAIRDHLWFWTDLLYKTGADQVARKRTAMNESAAAESTADFAPAKPVEMLEPPAKLELDERAWQEEVRRLSRQFAGFKNVMNSQVRMRAISSTYRLVNSEGSTVRVPQTLSDVDITAGTFAADGARIWNHRLITTLTPEQLPDEARLAATVKAVGTETEAIAKAPVGEDYSGPVLFEGEAAAELMAQLLTDTVRLQRRPLVPPGSNREVGEIVESVWASRVGSHVMPEWMSLIDDPHQKAAADIPLAGTYKVDDEGVPAERVVLVEKGVLKGFLQSRTPVRTFSGSNGHGRLPGGFGNAAAAFGNLFVQVNGGMTDQQLKNRLMKQVKQSGLKYGMLIRRIDFPSTANIEELQAMMEQMQKGGFLRSVNPPLLAFRVYPDGREELVRGLRFSELSAKDLRDISAASNHPYVLNYVNNGSALNLTDAGSEATTSSVICPSLLLESVDLARAEGNSGRLPLVPSPPITMAP